MVDIATLAEADGGMTIGDVLANKYLVAFVAALLGFLFSNVLEWRKNRKLPRKQLSWDMQVDSRLFEIESSLVNKVEVR